MLLESMSMAIRSPSRTRAMGPPAAASGEQCPMDAPFVIPPDYAAPALPNLTIPTLVLWGMDDFALPPENLDGLDAIIDDLTVVEVPGAGHFVTWEAPDAVNAALDAFLARTED